MNCLVSMRSHVNDVLSLHHVKGCQKSIQGCAYLLSQLTPASAPNRSSPLRNVVIFEKPADLDFSVVIETDSLVGGNTLSSLGG
jgi:hypothetical protein